jgi:hypothetical protein
MNGDFIDDMDDKWHNDSLNWELDHKYDAFEKKEKLQIA